MALVPRPTESHYHWTEISNPLDQRKTHNPLVDPNRWWYVELPKDRTMRCRFCGRPRMSFKEGGSHRHGFSIHVNACSEKFEKPHPWLENSGHESATQDGSHASSNHDQSSLGSEHSFTPEVTESSLSARKRVLSWAHGLPAKDKKSAGKLRAAEQFDRASKRPCYSRGIGEDSEAADDKIEARNHLACMDQARQLLKQLEKVRSENERLTRNNEHLANANSTLRQRLDDCSQMERPIIPSKKIPSEVWIIGYQKIDASTGNLVSKQTFCVCTSADSARGGVIDLARYLEDTSHENHLLALDPNQLEDGSFAINADQVDFMEYITVQRRKIWTFSVQSDGTIDCDGTSDFASDSD